ncbi:MAG: NAD(P)H-binding protein [Hyphomicrobiales bacterium]|nr:NAD(P)H-binding protein [Hyphomicrobiales bacterium]
MRILVTGANGFIGAEIVRRLITDGHEVVGAVRDVEDLQRRLPGVEPVRADFTELRDAESWRLLLAGIDAVVNCVGVLENGGKDSLNATHVDGASALFAACAEFGPRRIVHISAIGVGNEAGTGYAQSKAWGDEKLRETDLDWVILQPSLVIGRTVYGGTALVRGLAGLPGLAPSIQAGGTFRPVTIDDVTACVAHFVVPEAPSRLTLEIAGPDPVTLDELIRKYRAWLGLGPGYRLKIPGWFTAVMGAFGDFAHLLGWRSAICSTALKQMAFNVGGDAEKWQETTGISAEPLDRFLARHPATVQDRWHAGLYLLKPLLIVGLAISVGFAGLASALTLGFRGVVGGSNALIQIQTVDLIYSAVLGVFGILILLRSRHRSALRAMAVIALCYAFIAVGLRSAFGFWLVFGDSNIPAIALVPAVSSIFGSAVGPLQMAVFCMLLLVLDRSR